MQGITSGASAAVRLVPDEYRLADGREAPVDHFSIWGLAGRKRLFGGGADLQLVIRSSTQSARLYIADRLCAGDRFAYQIPAGAAQGAALRTVAAFHALHAFPSDGRQGAANRSRPNRSVPRAVAPGARRPRRWRLPTRARRSDLWARRRRSRLATGRRTSRSGAVSHPQGPSADGRGIPDPDRPGPAGSRFPGRAVRESHFP